MNLCNTQIFKNKNNCNNKKKGAKFSDKNFQTELKIPIEVIKLRWN